MKMKVYREWLCDEGNNIVKKPLSFWFEYFKIVPGSEEWRWYWVTQKEGKRIDIYRKGGYGITHDEYEQYKDKIFFCGNADLDTHKLQEVYD